MSTTPLINRCLQATALLASLLVFPASVEARVYTCHDPDGSTRFTDTPCNARTHSLRKLSGSVTRATPGARAEKTDKLLRAYQDERRIRREEAEHIAAIEAAEDAQCKQARDQLHSLEIATTVYRVDGNGVRTAMSDVERTDQVNSVKAKIERFCVVK